MFEWLEEIEKPHRNESSYDGLFKIKKLESSFEPSDISEVGQLFAAYSVIIGSDAMTQIPTPNENAISLITTEITPHYTDVKESYYNGVLRSINVMGLKPNSKKLSKISLLTGFILL
ncbi:hypothetical protein [Paenibacillus nasutitermitis]|uniref:Uncharacterized protein n=1 Tax=Paenibacillus nasutitermitis TaxID=1652958 RepID=A0A916ZLA9_9BACL|nr:hypothetical protein [Paenibacillus nasutitermitis]GGE03044.1 hypothetical protein GCM10010911_72660 [Paenibacillus nasutitermitis]